MSRIMLMFWFLSVWWVGVASAQVGSITKELHVNEAGDENGEEISIDGRSSISLTVTISGTATVTFQATQDQSTWASVACIEVGDTAYTSITNTNATMTVRCNVAGLVKFRAPTSGNTGTVNVRATASSAVMGSGGGGGGGGSAASGLDANFDLASGNIITGSSEAKRFELYGVGAQSAKAWVGYVGSDGNFYWTCLDTTVDNCDKNIKLVTGKSFQILNNGGISTFVVTEAGSVSKATIDCSAADVSCTVTRTKEFEFVACQAGVAGHIWNTPAANAPAEACDANNTNTIKGYASFDATTDERIDASMFLPPGYVAGSLGVTFIWKAAATSGAVGLCMRAVRVPDGAVSDAALPAQGAENCVSDTAKGTTLQENHASIAAVTCTSCVASDEIKIAFERDANGSAVTDDMTGDAHVIKAVVNWKELQ